MSDRCPLGYLLYLMIIWDLNVSVPGHCLSFYLASDHFQEVYNIMLPGSSGIMSPGEVKR